jgi:hypothetical protein
VTGNVEIDSGTNHPRLPQKDETSAGLDNEAFALMVRCAIKYPFCGDGWGCSIYPLFLLPDE